LLRGNLIPNNDNSEFNGDIYLAGHSMGGAMSVMCASRRKINKIALWASISTFGRYTPRQKKIWRKRGELNATVQKTGQKLPIGTDYLDDIEQNAEEFDPVASIRGIDSQILIIHPKQDVTVNKDEALRLAGSAGTEPVFIEKAGHTFGAGHPMGEPPEAVERATELTLRFFGLL
jgi:pimeloyl-ACP methyl ester carboxylesterase